MPRRWTTALLTGALVLAVLVTASIVFIGRSTADPDVTASSGTAGSARAAQAVSRNARPDKSARVAPTPAPAAAPTTAAAATTEAAPAAPAPVEAEADVFWQSDGETVGAWVQLTWPEPTTVDHVDVQAAASAPFASAELVFDAGAPVPLTPDSSGAADLDFEPREVTTAKLVVTEVPAGTSSVALTHFVVDNSGTGVPGSVRAEDDSIATTSSATAAAGALRDGDVAGGAAGAEWTASADDATPWVQLSWDEPRELASIQVLGPTANAIDPAMPWNAPLHGTLRFSDGSTVAVSGIAGNSGPPTTIAFSPRTASWVKLELARTVATTPVSLREFSAFAVGTTPPRWPRSAYGEAEVGYSATATPAAPCSASSDAVGRTTGDQLALVCPAPGSAVSGNATVVVAGPAGAAVTVTGWVDPAGGAPGAETQIAAGTIGSSGRVVLAVDMTVLPAGPTALRVDRAGQGGSGPLYVQLVNRSGVALDTGDHAPAGMTLQYAEEFTEPLSISGRGTETEYAATKPSHVGGGSFGDAWFADPAEGAGTLTTLDEDYLRLRVQPSDPATTPWGLRHEGGILSSARVGGSGFAAQYGYFEARMLGAPGVGSWPAFWMLDTENTTPRGTTASEVDAVELYGHNTTGSCHTTHNWGYGTDDGGAAKCLDDNGFGDWALSWHTYGVRFVPGGADFYVDGVQVATYQGLRQAADPHYFLVNLALGGGWPVDLARTGDVTDLYVDWVRAYT